MTAKTGKGGKAACEAAGWRFIPIAEVYTMTERRGDQMVKVRHRSEGRRGVTAVPPTGSGIEPQHFGGSGRAVAWAVEQLAEVARRPEQAPAGFEGIKQLLDAALASGEVCTGPDETPEKPDGLLLSVCTDALTGGEKEKAQRNMCWPRPTTPEEGNALHRILSDAMKVRRDATVQLIDIHATTHHGLMQKARATVASFDACGITGQQKIDLAKTVIEDMILLLPTLALVDRRVS